MSTTEWAKNPQTNAPRSITEPAAPEPLGDSEGAATQVVAGLEPVAWRWVWKSARDRAELCYTHTFPANNELMDVESLYSAATVERLVQERDRLQTIDLDLQMAVQKLTAMTQERDEYKSVALENRDALATLAQERDEYRDELDELERKLAASQAEITRLGGVCSDYRQAQEAMFGDLAAMTKKADGFFDALQLAAKINAEGQAREQQLREALEICQAGMPGDKWDSLYIDGVLAFPQDDTALNTLLAAGQAREQQLREALELAEKLNILPEAPNDKAQGAGGGLIARRPG